MFYYSYEGKMLCVCTVQLVIFEFHTVGTTMKILVVASFCVALVCAVKPPCDNYPCLQLNKEEVVDEYVDFKLVGTDVAGLECRTDLMTCCSRYEGRYRGNWYDPESKRLPFESQRGSIYQRRKCETVSLERRKDKCNKVGNYCCHIPTVAKHWNSTAYTMEYEQICVYLYHETEGEVQQII